MPGYRFITLLFTIFLTASAEIAVQTDWSSGPGIPGPVSQWEETFDVSEFMDWALSPGQLLLQTGCIEHLIADYLNPAFLATADFNNDSIMDVACASYDGDKLFWFENDGTGLNWIEHPVEPYLPAACVISTGDIDKDGDPDLMCASEGGDGVCWWSNENWADSWTKHTVDPNCNYPFSIEPADFDCDGDIDLCAALYGRGEIAWYSNQDSIGTVWKKRIVKDAFPQVWWAVPDDFNGDSIPDIAGARHGGDIFWWENDGTGNSWTEHPITTGYSLCTTIRNCDLNGDGAPDIAASSSGPMIAWWENSNSGLQWIQHTVDSNLVGSWSLWAEDMDNDGDQDLIGNDRAGDHVYWYENLDSEGTLWMRWLLDDGTDMSNDVNAADLDGDGYPDPIATFGGDNSIYWWKLTDVYEDNGFLESSILDMGQDAQWGTITWVEDTPAGTEVQVSVRAGDFPDSLGEWVPVLSSGDDLSAYIPDNSWFFQYRIDLTAASGTSTPVFSDLSIEWDPMGIPGSSRQLTLGTPFPNPARSEIVIPLNLPFENGISLTVHDLYGRQVAVIQNPETLMENESISWNCNGLPSGEYYILLKGNGHTFKSEFVILR